jgi:hypothetical protein
VKSNGALTTIPNAALLFANGGLRSGWAADFPSSMGLGFGWAGKRLFVNGVRCLQEESVGITSAYECGNGTLE